jgi:hypothetical protein
LRWRGRCAVLSVKEAAAHARVCESVVRGWIKSGLLPHYRLGLKRGKIAIAIEDLDGLLAGFKVAKKEPEPTKAPAPKSAFKHLRLS